MFTVTKSINNITGITKVRVTRTMANHEAGELKLIKIFYEESDNENFAPFVHQYNLAISGDALTETISEGYEFATDKTAWAEEYLEEYWAARLSG